MTNEDKLFQALMQFDRALSEATMRLNTESNTMTNEELTQALQALADEFGGTFDLISDENEDDYYATMDIGENWVQFHRYIDTRWVVGARIGGDGVDEESGLVDARHSETILIWLRTKLLELTRKEREKYFYTMIECLVDQEDLNVIATAIGELYTMVFGVNND